MGPLLAPVDKMFSIIQHVASVFSVIFSKARKADFQTAIILDSYSSWEPLMPTRSDRACLPKSLQLSLVFNVCLKRRNLYLNFKAAMTPISIDWNYIVQFGVKAKIGTFFRVLGKSAVCKPHLFIKETIFSDGFPQVMSKTRCRTDYRK